MLESKLFLLCNRSNTRYHNIVVNWAVTRLTVKCKEEDEEDGKLPYTNHECMSIFQGWGNVTK